MGFVSDDDEGACLTMARTGVITDSTAELPPGVAQEFGIVQVPLVVNWDGQTYRDKTDLSTAEFYQRLRASKSLPKTGAPSPGAFKEAFEQHLQTFDDVLCVTLGAGFSGTFEAAKNAAELVDPQRIRVVESGTVSICLGWMAEEAARMGAREAGIDAILAKIEEMRPRIRILVALDTLEYLQKGGRIGRAQALAGTLLNVKPIISLKDGQVHPFERVRTFGAAARRLVEVVAGMGPLEKVAVIHGDAEAQADAVAAQVQERFPGQPVLRGEIGAVVGVHAGPGMVAAAALLANKAG